MVSQPRIADDLTQHCRLGNCVRVVLGVGEVDYDGARNLDCHHRHRFLALVVADEIGPARPLALIRDLATDRTKREMFDRLHEHLNRLADEVEQALNNSKTD
jgi:hypothetical protein